MNKLSLLFALMTATEPAVGLKERRAIKAFQDNIYPELKKQIDATTGMDVQMEVDWFSIAEKDYAHMYDEAFEKVYFVPLQNALKEICADDMGKEALEGSLKKIVIKNSSNGYSLDNFKFDDGVLVIDHSPITNIDYIKDRSERILTLLENGL